MMLIPIEIIDYLNKFFISKNIPNILIKYIFDFVEIRTVKYVYYDLSNSCRLIVGDIKINPFTNVDTLLKIIFKNEKNKIDNFQCIILKNRKYITYKKIGYVPETLTIYPTKYSLDSLYSDFGSSFGSKKPVELCLYGKIPENYYQIFIKNYFGSSRITTYIVSKETKIHELKRDYLIRSGLEDDNDCSNNIYFSFCSKKLCLKKTLEDYKIFKENTIFVRCKPGTLYDYP